MADARALLRQQRAARRIDHPYASYSDSGKLLCTLCHEPVKTESLWDSHVRSKKHATKVQAKASATSEKTRTLGAASEAAPHSNKRKHGDEAGPADEEATRAKRSKSDVNTSARLPSDKGTTSEAGKDKDKDKDKDLQEATRTSPSLTRSLSTTPGQGVEMQIASRPATPQHRDGTSSAASTTTPSAAPHRPSPLVPQGESLTPRQPTNPPASSSSKDPEAAKVDEDEWAAFEADIAATSIPYAEDAVISAAPMSAEEQAAAAKSIEEEQERKRLEAEKALADEKEEAARALEVEFEEMEELEARVRKLKERREALRAQSGGAAVEKPADDAGKENMREAAANGVKNEEDGEDDEDDEEDEDEEDDFMGFRFKG
ncbi:hypothetical protein ACRALDRAFT_2023509 [Sodiomyces alcalophilus JCM 7366]|uniref:uncharacterized protein n=1 Tax=Sodiomyces alcalophilus JCM 7366 TaxID=591952 RepID=UPI0039B4B02E